MLDDEEQTELPLAAAWEEVKRTRITGLSALEDAQSALAALNALVGGGNENDDHRRHPAVLRLLSQCPFPQLASYIASGSGPRKKSGKGSSSCFPPAGGKSARGAASADRRLSEATLALGAGAEAAERAARAAGDLASIPEEEVEALLAGEARGLGSPAEAEEEEAVVKGEKPDDVPSRRGLRGLSLASAGPVALAAVADALELLAKMRRAVASGEVEKKEEEVEGGEKTCSSSSSQPQPLPPAACPWSSPDHLHSYALFWDLAPFVDERDVEVALAVERAAWRKRRRREGGE